MNEFGVVMISSEEYKSLIEGNRRAENLEKKVNCLKATINNLVNDGLKLGKYYDFVNSNAEVQKLFDHWKGEKR